MDPFATSADRPGRRAASSYGQSSASPESGYVSRDDPELDGILADPLGLHQKPHPTALPASSSASPRLPPAENGSFATESLHEPRPTQSLNEYEPPQVGNLGVLDVFALIVNKMIGTGIYTNPATVLTLAGSPEMAILFWVVGVVYTIISIFIYLSCASVIPFNGGELTMLDELTSHDGGYVGGSRYGWVKRWLRRFMGNGLFAYTIYAFVSIFTSNSGTNCLEAARQILIAAKPYDQYPMGLSVRSIAVASVTIVCFLHYIWPAAARSLNVILAFVKVVLILVLIIAGAILWKKHHIVAQVNTAVAVSKSDNAKALLLIVFTFQGWENTTFAAGEIPRNSHHVLRKGTVWAVGVVSLLYIAVNTIFLFGLIEYNANDITPQPGRQNGPFLGHPLTIQSRQGLTQIASGANIAPLFFGNSAMAIRSWGSLTAVSALGSVIPIVYHLSHMKQAIGRMNILPWSALWGADDRRTSSGSRDFGIGRSPRGGLILHWMITVGLIAATATINDTLDAASFPGLLQTYGHAAVLIPLAFSFCRLRARAEALHFNINELHSPIDRFLAGLWRKPNLRNSVVLFATLLGYISFNAFLLIGFAIPPYDGIDGRVLPIIIGSLVLFAVIYYFSLFGSFLPRLSDPDIGRSQVNNRVIKPWSLLSLANVTMDIKKSEEYRNDIFYAVRFGSRRRITYQNGDRAFLLYWLFGGGKLDYTPWQAVEKSWLRVKSWFS